MKHFLTLTLEGHFPGAPEKDTVEISEEDYDRLWQQYIKPKAVKEGWSGSDQELTTSRFYKAKREACRRVRAKAGLPEPPICDPEDCHIAYQCPVIKAVEDTLAACRRDIEGFSL